MSSQAVTVSRDDLNMIIRTARRLERLSSDILETSRIESQSLVLHKEQFDLNEKIRNVSNDFRELALTKDVELAFQPSDQSIVVEADKSRIYEVISNLISNAIKFTEFGRITIVLKKTGNEATVTVTDTEKGIDAEMMPRLFSKFATKSDQGTGLGLYISKSIIEAMVAEFGPETGGMAKVLSSHSLFRCKHEARKSSSRQALTKYENHLETEQD